jgi:hypothetical protein
MNSKSAFLIDNNENLSLQRKKEGKKTYRRWLFRRAIALFRRLLPFEIKIASGIQHKSSSFTAFLPSRSRVSWGKQRKSLKTGMKEKKINHTWLSSGSTGAATPEETPAAASVGV